MKTNMCFGLLARALFGKICKSNCGTENQRVREKWMELQLKKIPSATRILDAGAGERTYEKFCAHLDYVAQDFAEYDGVGDSRGLQTGQWDQSRLDIVSDITDIPEPDGSFGAVMCFEVLEHLPRPELAIKELARLLKPGGKLLVTAPFCSLTHFAPFHFATGFNTYFYEEILPANGLKIIEYEKNGNYFSFLAQELRRIRFMEKKYAPPKSDCGFRKRLLRDLAIRALLEWLGELEEHDSGSSDLLCFGIHILAEKIG